MEITKHDCWNYKDYINSSVFVLFDSHLLEKENAMHSMLAYIEVVLKKSSIL